MDKNCFQSTRALVISLSLFGFSLVGFSAAQSSVRVIDATVDKVVFYWDDIEVAEFKLTGTSTLWLDGGPGEKRKYQFSCAVTLNIDLPDLKESFPWHYRDSGADERNVPVGARAINAEHECARKAQSAVSDLIRLISDRKVIRTKIEYPPKDYFKDLLKDSEAKITVQGTKVCHQEYLTLFAGPGKSGTIRYTTGKNAVPCPE